MYVILKQTGDRSLLSLNFLDEADFSNKDELATRNIRILEHYDDDSSHWTTYVNDAQMFDDYDEALILREEIISHADPTEALYFVRKCVQK